ncbi:MAG: hypothetical protein AB7S78_12840 [Candidatus Omnitrophota bacterium]
MSKLTSNKPTDWNADQNAVWKSLEDHWELLITKRVDEFIEYIHLDMIGYGHESPLPVDRPWLEKWVGFWTQSTDIIICELKPINIKLHGHIAIVQYFIFTIEKSERGIKHVIRRYTMTWQRGEKHWFVIASHNNLMNDHLHG